MTVNVKYQFFICAGGTDKTTVTLIQRIRTIGDDVWYEFPAELQKISHHEELTELRPFKSAIKVLKSRGQYRTITVSLSPEMQELYVDPDGNFEFKEYLLPEYRFPPPSAVASPPPQILSQAAQSSDFHELAASISKLAGTKEDSAKELTKNFLINKYSFQNKNALGWLLAFEKEADRYKLDGHKKIEVFKACLDSGSPQDWFEITQNRLSLDAPWSSWRAEFLSTFRDSSFRPICYAYMFKFINGSLLEYAVRKEKMLLNVDTEVSDSTIVNLIVMGLPSHIQAKLNILEVTSIKILQQKLKKFESESKINEDSNVKFSSNNFLKTNLNKNSNVTDKNKFSKGINSQSKFSEKKPNTSSERKPCSICSSKGFSGRYHPEAVCWLKDKVNPPVRKESNKLEVDTDALSSDEEQAKN